MGDKDLESFLAGHHEAFRGYGELPEVIRPDCLRSAVRIWRGAASAFNKKYRILEEHPQHLGNREDDLAVRDVYTEN